MAEDLTAAAHRMLVAAGATEDGRARARLLASTSHTLTRDILGAMLPPEAEQAVAADLAGPRYPDRWR